MNRFFFLFTLVLALPAPATAQTVQAGLYRMDDETVSIRLKADQDLSGLLTQMTFTLNWPAELGGDLVSVRHTEYDLKRVNTGALANKNGESVGFAQFAADFNLDQPKQLDLKKDRELEVVRIGVVDGVPLALVADEVMDLATGEFYIELNMKDYTADTPFYSQEVASAAEVAEAGLEIPGSHELGAAYPNPFNPQTQFSLAVAQEQVVRVDVFDVTGRLVQTLYDGPMSANQVHRFTFDGRDLSSGTYIYRVVGEQFVESRRVIMVK